MSGSFDASDFLRGLNLADQRVRRGAARGVAKCLLHLERLAKERVPVDAGTLAGTIVGDVNGIEATADKVEGVLTAGGGEASDYAVRQHEEQLHHTFPRDGVFAAKYVEGPIAFFAPQAARVIADEIRQEIGS